MRRIIALLLAAALLIPMVGCEQKEAQPAEVKPQSEPFARIPISDGSTVELYLCADDDYTVSDVFGYTGKPGKEYALMEYRGGTYNISMGGIGSSIGDSGDVNVLCYADPTAGELFFIESTAAVPIEVRITKPEVASPVTLRKIVYGTPEEPTPETLAMGDGYDSETSLYMENDGLHLMSGRALRLTYKGQTVCEVSTFDPSTRFSTEGGFEFATRLSKGDADKVSWHFAVCDDQLVDWDTYYRAMKVVNFGATDEYTFLGDGHYYAKPTDYDPCANQPGRFIYKTAASFVHRSAVEQDCGAYLRLLGLYLMYTRIESYNDEGYVPNPCTSLWLKGDYGIEAGFYDTRFNTDAIRALMFAENAGDEPLIRQTVEKALDFYLSFHQKQGFNTDGSFFVPDYMGAGQNKTTHSSLNHYLAEAMALIEAGNLYDIADYREAGVEIFDQIEKTYDRWIRPNGDLWYGVTVDGEMIRDDYVSVTYNDLVAAVKLMNSMGILENYPGIRALLDSKESWLNAAGYAGSVVAHP